MLSDRKASTQSHLLSIFFFLKGISYTFYKIPSLKAHKLRSGMKHSNIFKGLALLMEIPILAFPREKKRK